MALSNASMMRLSGDQGTFAFTCLTISRPYTAHYFGTAQIQDGWEPMWFFGSAAPGCGQWDPTPAKPRPDDPGALVHYGNGDNLYPGQVYPKRYIPAGGYILSNGGAYRLQYQSADGNLVLINTSDESVAFNFAVPPHIPGPKARAIMQADGNFVIYRDAPYTPDNAVCQTHTHGHPGAYLVVQPDGNVVIYDITSDVLYVKQQCQ